MNKIFFIVLLLTSLNIWAQKQGNYYEKAIQRFEAQDKKQFPAKNSVLFIGSSSIRGWKTLAQDFPEIKTIPRGFGGSQTSDVLYFMDRIVLPYKPKAIVFYCGENDIAAKKPYTTPVADFKKFVAHIRKHLTTTKIFYMSMKPSPSRWHLWPKMQKGNKKIRDYCLKNSQETLFYIDISKAMIHNNEPNKTIFIPDMLHMNAKGYAIWTKIVKAELKKRAVIKMQK